MLMLSLSPVILGEHILQVRTPNGSATILNLDVARVLLELVVRCLLELGFQLWQIH